MGMPGFSWDAQARCSILRVMTWLMSSLCRGSPAPPMQEVECCFDYFVQVVCFSDDAQMCADSLWGLCYLLEGAPDQEDGCRRAKRLLSTGFPTEEATPMEHPLLTKV